MKITFRRCSICANFHNHLSCPYCGALPLTGHTVNVVSGRDMIRALPLPRAYESPLVITRLTRNQVVSRIAR